MAAINIRSDVSDKFYRYKMPPLQTKVEGKGNGVKTVLPNISDIARALSRPPTYPTKFFGCELGAQTMWDEPADRYIVNGIHDASRLKELLDSFIDKFVLCGACKNPETDIILTKDENILRDCKACGERKPVDMRHKLCTFIVKNPPKRPSKKKRSQAGNENGGNENGDGREASGDDEMSRKIAAGAKEMANTTPALDADSVDWATDTSKEAVAARMKALNSNLQANLILNPDEDDEEGGGPYEAFRKWIVDTRGSSTDAEIYKKAVELGIEKKHKTAQALVEGLFTEDVVNEIEGHAPLLIKLSTGEKHQKSLLGGIERLVGVVYPDLIPATPKILMSLYQCDVLEEEPAKSWGTHVSKKYVDRDTSKKVRKAAQPFITWLENQESDDDDEDDEDED